jgi:hypothetical protein
VLKLSELGKKNFENRLFLESRARFKSLATIWLWALLAGLDHLGFGDYDWLPRPPYIAPTNSFNTANVGKLVTIESSKYREEVM